jgi:AcrR family transcriptional regulator
MEPVMADRREEILAADTALFSERGYADVGMVDIGAACNLSAAAIYLSFPSKGAVLDAVCTRFMQRVEDHLRAQLSALDDPSVRFRRRMFAHAQFVVEHRDELRVVRRDVEHLPSADQERIWEIVRWLMSFWIDDLLAVRTDLSRPEARVAAYAGLAVLQSIATYASQLPDADLVALLASIAGAAQLSQWPPESVGPTAH